MALNSKQQNKPPSKPQPRKARGPHIEETALMQAIEEDNSPEAIAAMMGLADEAEADWEQLAAPEFKGLLGATEDAPNS